MKFIIDQSESKKDLEPIIELKLQRGHNGKKIYVTTPMKEDPNEEWYLLSFNPDGTISRCGGISDDLGFKTNKISQIMLTI